MIFSLIDPAQIELDCASNEPYERIVRFIIRSRFGEMTPITPEELQDVRGFTKLRPEPTIDLLRLERAIQLAEKRAAVRGITPHQRIVRHNEVDALRNHSRYLLNVEAGDKYSAFDLKLLGCGPIVAIGAHIARGRK